MSQKSLAWLGTFPSHWDVMPNKALIKKVKRPVKVGSELPQLLSLTKQGVIVRNLEQGGKFPENFDTYQIVKPGDLVTCLFDVPETPRTIGISRHHGMITGAYDIFEFTDRIHPEYFEYVYLYLDDRKALSCFYTGLRNVIRTPTFLSIPTPVPPLEEQRAIADYIDYKQEKFSVLMENLENLFKLAEERSNSAICYLTTGSVNQLSEAQNLDSWLSDAPETWKRGSLKRFCDITLGKMVSPNLGENDNYYPYLKASSIQPKGNLVLDEEIRMPFTTREIEKLSIKQGDVLVVEGGSIGRTAYFSDDLPGWGFQNSLNRVRVKNQGYGRYASYIIEAARISGVFDAITSVSTIAHLTAEKLEQVRIVWPPYEDQVSISEDLHHELGNLYRLQELIGELIGVTSERMKARIAAAVTGQLNTGIYVNG